MAGEPKPHDFRADLTWKRTAKDFVYETYDRSHTIKFEGGQKITGSAAVEFNGKAEFTNPEELIAASLAGCHLLTFLAVACKSKLTIDSYSDTPIATLEKGPEGKLCVTKIRLQPKVVFSGEVPNREKIVSLHEKAHANCMIGNSIKCEVVIDPKF